MLQFGVNGIDYIQLKNRMHPSYHRMQFLITDLYRYFVITDSKLIYYVAMDRSVMKGEIVLAGVKFSFHFIV